MFQSIKNWVGPYQRTPKEVARAILDTQVFSGSVQERSCWRFLGFRNHSALQNPKIDWIGLVRSLNHESVDSLMGNEKKGPYGWLGDYIGDEMLRMYIEIIS